MDIGRSIRKHQALDLKVGIEKHLCTLYFDYFLSTYRIEKCIPTGSCLESLCWGPIGTCSYDRRIS